MSLARNRSLPESPPSSQPERRGVMEFAAHRGSSAGAAGLLVVPGPNYPDLDVDLDDEDEDVVIRIRPKSSPQPRRKTSLDEEDSDISEPPSLSGSRRVSFADAVGLSLVQVKEFDKWDVPQLPDFLDSISKDQEEYFISPFNFTLSLSSEEIAAKVTDHKVELESIELLPGTTILKGVIRVLNISFTKAVYVRTSLDNWVSHFDLLSEYIPGSSEGHTDSFSFKLTLVPPFAEQGARVDFCLRYETPCGTFWTNNSNRNYVLFCYKRKKEVQDKPQKENVKKSCLKTVSPSFSVEESMSSPEQEDDAPDAMIRQKSNNDSQSNESISSPAERSEEDGSLSQVENRQNRSRRNRRKAAKVARVRDYFGQKDSTTQDSETQPSPKTQTETAQEQNIEKRHSDCKGNIQLEDNADALLLNSSNNKQHEKLNPADAAISTDESGDLPNTAPTLHQNINKFVSSSSEERGPEAAGDSTRLSGERVDSEKLVSDSGGFAFGTVVAPLYHQVSCRVGGQIHSETRSSAFTKDQREAGGRSSSGEMNDCKDVGLYRDEKVESVEQCRAVMDVVEMLKDPKELENVAKINTKDSPFVETNSIPDPNPMNSLLNLSEKILDVERELQDEKLSLDIQATFAHEAHSFGNIGSHDKNKDETVLLTGELQSPYDIEKQPCQCNSPENNVVASSLTNTLIQEENIALPSQTSQNECRRKLESSCKDLSLEFVDKTLAIALEDISGKSQEDNVSLLLQPLHNQGFSDQFINITDNIKEPSIDGAKSDIFNDENPLLTSEDLPSSLDPPSILSNIMQERSPEIDKKTMTSPSHAHEVAEDANPSLLLEHILADESVNITSLIKEKSRDTDAGIAFSNHISITSTEQNPHLTSQLAEKDNSANHPNLSQDFDSQTMAASSTIASETPEEISLLEQNEDLGKKSSRRHKKSAPKSQIQETVENSFLLLEQNSSVPVSLTNSTNYVKKHDDLAGTVVSPTSGSKLYVENSTLSLQLSHNDKFTGPDEFNVDNDEKMSQNHTLTERENESESKHFSQNKELPDQSKNSSEPKNLDLDHELSKTVALSACDRSLLFTEENPYLPIQVLENQPPNTKDLVAHPYERQESTETMAILPKKEGENSIGHIDPSVQEIVANSVAFVEVMEEREVATSCKGIVDKEIRPLNIVLSNKNVTMLSVGEIAKSKAENDNCVTETTKFVTDNVIQGIPEDVEQCKMSQMNTMEDEPKKLKIVKGKEDFNELILHTGNEEMRLVEDEFGSNLVEDVVWQVSDTNINLERAEQLEKAKVLSFKTEEDAMNELERAQEPTSRNEECFDSPFETEMLALCPDDEEKEGDRASESRSTSGAMNEKELNESIASQIVGFDADYKEEEQVKMLWETDEEERSERLPCKVECNLSAPMDNVQVGIESIRKKITIETPDMPVEIDKTDFPHCSNDTKDWSEGASQVQGSTFTENLKYEQTGDNDNSQSDTDSGSEDEMELYMHCLRAVYGQQSSPKATRPEQNREKEFKRLSVSRGKRLSTSLPSISESLDEEQQCFKQEKEPERMEVQPAAPLLPDSSHKEEIDKYLWWKETFSCRNVLKAMLYAILVLVFLAVAYHYDFIACFGLYVISVIWLFFQGERQTGKNNKAT